MQTQVYTKAEKWQKSVEGGVIIGEKDADEFRAYKRKKKLDEIALGIMRSQATLMGGEDVQRVCERAVRLGQPAVRLPATKLFQAKYYLGKSAVRMDCQIGGNGETATKVKRYEAKLAVRKNAKEITLVVTPSWMDCCRYSEVRKEIKAVKRAVRHAYLKVRVEKAYSLASLSRLARVVCECKAQFFSVPYFDGCERLRLDLTGGCKLEVSGVNDLQTYKKLLGAGVARIVTEHAWEIYTAWMRETSVPTFLPIPESPVPEKVTAEPKAVEGIEKAVAQTDTNVDTVSVKPMHTDGKWI
ncbi:MAG: hypothetical protein IJ996_00050 [Clostridia bacterium]|nr:hypothetical protein [Clostridia bacterium]